MRRSPLRSRGKGDSRYMRLADDLFMSQFRGNPCEICRSQGKYNLYGTAGHHIIPKARSRALRYEKRNIVTVCPAHHTTGGDICPHSLSKSAVDKFEEWVQNNRPKDWQYLQEHKNDIFSGLSYRAQYLEMKSAENE